MYKYYKIKMSKKDFDNGVKSFIKNDSKFSKIFNAYSSKFRIEIYEKFNNLRLTDNKKYNYVIVNVEGEELNENTLDHVFNQYLKRVSIRGKNIMCSYIYMIFVIFNTNKINKDLLRFIENGFNTRREGRFNRYITIPVIFEDDTETLYISCNYDNKLEYKWFGSDMIIWILENLQEKNIEFNKISLVKSSGNKKNYNNVYPYENTYTREIVLELENKKKIVYIFIFVLIYNIYYFTTKNIFLAIFPFILLIRFLYILLYKGNMEYLKFNKINLTGLKLSVFKDKIINRWKNNPIIFIDKYTTIDFNDIFSDIQNYYIILLDDFYEQDLLNSINKLSDESKKNILILKNDNNEFLSFIKDDNKYMKKKLLKYIGKVL